LPVGGGHGRRATKTYPPTPNTTGIIINIPSTVLIIVSRLRCVVARRRRFLVKRRRSELNNYVGTVGTAASIA
jgi:hypothetical protein